MSGQIIVLPILILLSGFFSSSETAFTSLNLYQIDEMKKEYPKSGKLVEKMYAKSDALLATVLIGNNIVNVLLSVIATELTIDLFGSEALGITTGILTLAILLFGEIVPKQLAITHNVTIARFTVRIIKFLSIIFTPFIWFVGSLSKLFSRLSPKTPRTLLTLDGILHMVKRAESSGILEHYRSKMVKNIFRLNDVAVHSIMTHRTKVFSLPATMKIEEAFPLITEAGYSRIPVYNKDPENIVGIVLEKDLITNMHKLKRRSSASAKASDKDPPAVYLRDLMHDPIVVPETWKIHKVFGKLKREQLNMAIVLDEYGGLAGVVSMEDLVEEIIGEIYDEHEEREALQVLEIETGSYSIQGDTPLYILEDILGEDIEHDKSIQTVGGYLASLTDSLPSVGARIEAPIGVFKVEKISKKQILTVRFDPKPQHE